MLSALSRLTVSEGVSFVGTQLTRFALPVAAVTLLHSSSLYLGVLGAAFTLPNLVLGLSAGVLSDRHERRLSLLASDTGRIVTLVLLAALVAVGRANIWLLIGAAFILGVGDLVFETAFVAYIPAVLPSELLIRANARLEMCESAAETIGPGIAGAVIEGLGVAAALAGDAISYVVSMAALLTLPRSRPAAPAVQEAHHVAIRRQVAMIAKDRVLFPMALSAGTANFFMDGFVALLSLFVLRTLHLSVGAYAVLGVVEGLAGLLGGVVGQRIPRKVSVGRVMISAYLVSGVSATMMSLTPKAGFYSLIWLCLFQSILVMSVVVNLVVGTTVMQRVVEGDVLGRIAGAMRFFSWGPGAAGALAAGAVAGVVGVRGALVGAGFGAIGAAWWLKSRAILRLPSLSELTRDPPEDLPGTSSS